MYTYSTDIEQSNVSQHYFIAEHFAVMLETRFFGTDIECTNIWHQYGIHKRCAPIGLEKLTLASDTKNLYS